MIQRTNKLEEKFTQIDNTIIERLKPKELGILCYMLSKAEYHNFTIQELENVSQNGIYSIRAGLKELKEKGYILISEEKNQLGQYTGRYIVRENPNLLIDVNSKINIYRTKKEKNFTQIDNEFLNDVRLSFEAKGILFYMLSKPDYWQFYATEIQKSLHTGRKIVEKAIKELIEAGYIERTQKENSRIYEYTVFEKSMSRCEKSTKPIRKKSKADVEKVQSGYEKSTNSNTYINTYINTFNNNKSKSVNFDLEEKKVNIEVDNNTSNVSVIPDLKENNNQYAVGNSNIDNSSDEYQNSSNNEEYSHYRDFEMVEEEKEKNKFDFSNIETETPIYDLPEFLKSSLRTENNSNDNKDDEFLNSFENQDNTLNINKEEYIACQKNNDTDKEKITSNNEVNLANNNDNIEYEICQIEDDDDDDYISNEDIEALKEKYRIYISDICEFTNEQIIGLAREFNYHEIEEFLEYIKSCQYSSMFEFITCSV